MPAYFRAYVKYALGPGHGAQLASGALNDVVQSIVDFYWDLSIIEPADLLPEIRIWQGPLRSRTNISNTH